MTDEPASKRDDLIVKLLRQLIPSPSEADSKTPSRETASHPDITDAERLRIRAKIALAAEAIAYFWPMRTFIHHNPLHGFEHLPFDAAVRQASALFGGRGYLSNEAYREIYRSGRIDDDAIDRAIRKHHPDLAAAELIALGPRRIQPIDLLRLHLLHGSEEADAGEGFTDNGSREEKTSPGDLSRVGSQMTLAEWCRARTGNDVVAEINDQMIKWCAAFLDEGLAAWAMPSRERGFYSTWRDLASRDLSGPLLGIRGLREKIRDLPARNLDTVLLTLRKLGIREEEWTAYLTRHLAHLPGWAGFTKWRGDHRGYPWQTQAPIELAGYLAARLFYEAEWVDQVCRQRWDIPGRLPDLSVYFARKEAGRLEREPSKRNGASVEPFGVSSNHRDARRFFRLAPFLESTESEIGLASRSEIDRLLMLLDRFPCRRHGPVWLDAYEEYYQRNLIRRISDHLSKGPTPSSEMPKAQAVFCIDVREEALRRHLEGVGPVETYGFAGFFGVPISFRPFNDDEEADLCPVLIKPKHVVTEAPRPTEQATTAKQIARSRWRRVAHDLFHHLKYNLITPYVVVEIIGGFFALPFSGKTFFPRAYHAVKATLSDLFFPRVATYLVIEKISRQEAEAILASRERAAVMSLVAARLGKRRGSRLLFSDLEEIRLAALSFDGKGAPSLTGAARRLELGLEEEGPLLEELSRHHGINHREREERLSRIASLGFNSTEKAYFVETTLRLIGLTQNFARLVLFCGHGSATENNPYAAALDCGACGGHHGGPNARVLAAMANKPSVRALLRERGIDIPDETHFLAGEHNTTTDRVALFDTEVLPPTHRPDLERLILDLKAAGEGLAQERCRRLPGSSRKKNGKAAARHVAARSADWAQVQPEWGLSGNAAFIIGRRAPLRGLDLEGRVFLHSYDPFQDMNGKALETIMTAPLIVGEWINMEHYFSTVDNEIYGSGSKVIHNVVGGIGVMIGNRSDLQSGLPRQTVMDGKRYYHEPMRMLTLIEAPTDRVAPIIRRQPILQDLFHNQWIHLIVYDPITGLFRRYRSEGRWEDLPAEAPDRPT